MIEEILREFLSEFEEKLFIRNGRLTVEEYVDVDIWLKEKLTFLEKSVREETIDEVISYIGSQQGWEESEDIYRKHFGLKLKYK